MLGTHKSLPLFVLFLTLIFLISGLFLPVCLAQEAEEPPSGEEVPVLEQLREDLEEYLRLMGEGETEEAFKVMEEYLAALKDLAENPEGLMEAEAHAAHVLHVTSKHLAVLMRVYDKAPEEARKGIGNALVKGTRGHANAFEFTERAGEEGACDGEGAEMEEMTEEGEGAPAGKGKGVGKGKGKGRGNKNETTLPGHLRKNMDQKVV